MDTLISKESLLGKLEQLPPDQFYNIASIRNFIKAEEEAVTRCKDCKHYQFADNRAFGMPVKRCEWTGFEDVDDKDFCSRAESKDGR